MRTEAVSEPGTPRPRAALALLCVAQFIDVLGVTIVVVALPSIQRDLGLAAGELQWVVSVYALCFGGFLMVCGRAADVFGRLRLFRAGLAVFAAASLGCGLADSAPVLIGARALQGLGAALVVPAALSLLTTTFTKAAERARALAIWTAAAAGGGAAGFVLGGVITDALGWQWVFFVNVPVGVAALLIAPAVLRETRTPAAARRLDLLGAATVTAGLVALILAATNVDRSGPGDPGTVAALILAACLLAGFAIVERRVPDPLLPPTTLRSRSLVGANLAAFSLTAVTSPAGVLGTLYAQHELELDPTSTGLAFLPFSLAVIAGSALSPGLTRRVGMRTTMATGIATTGVAAAALSQLGTGLAGLPLLIAGLAVSGLGLGCAAVASTATGTAAAGADRQGLASGLLNTATQIGTALGVAALVTLAAGTDLRTAYLAAAVLAIVAALAVLRLRD
jgi:EmrB/QacA subfamily drug resistance transporter